MNFLVQIPSKGKLQIWFSEREEREGNERWLLSLTPPRKAVVNILSSSSGNRQDFVQTFWTSFPVFVEAVPHSPGIFRVLKVSDHSVSNILILQMWKLADRMLKGFV